MKASFISRLVTAGFESKLTIN